MNRWKQIVVWYEGMAPRERLIVTVGAAVLGLIVFFVGVYEPLVEGRRSLERRVADREREVAEIREVADRIMTLRQKLATFNTRLSQGADLSPLSELESLTNGLGIGENVAAMSPGQKMTVDGYEEQIVTLTLKKVSLGKVTGLLKALGSSKNGLKVKRLEIRPEFEDPSLLTVSLSVAAYEPA